MAGHSIETGKSVGVFQKSRAAFHASMPPFHRLHSRSWVDNGCVKESVFHFFLDFFAGLLLGQQRVNAAAQKCALENL